MARTVHVYRADHGWAVKREGAKSSRFFPTQKEAIGSAREIVRDSAPGQMVVHGKDGTIREHVAYGLPKVQDPPGKQRGVTNIEKAVGRVALQRVTSDRTPARA
jgi:hypothetical protein